MPEFPPPIRGSSSQIIYYGSFSYGLKNISLSFWNEGCNLYIGSFNSIGKYVSVILGGNHSTSWTSTYPFGHIHTHIFPPTSQSDFHPFSKGHVHISNDVWLGQSCTILSGVTLHPGCVVAAQSVVTSDVQPYTIVAGNPARPVRSRFPVQIVDALLTISWWEQPSHVIKLLLPYLQVPPTDSTIATMRGIIEHYSIG